MNNNDCLVWKITPKSVKMKTWSKAYFDQQARMVSNPTARMNFDQVYIVANLLFEVH